jgi:hypothetical protein
MRWGLGSVGRGVQAKSAQILEIKKNGYSRPFTSSALCTPFYLFSSAVFVCGQKES